MGDDPAHGERLLQSPDERDRLSCRHFAAALLRSESRRRRQLRGYGRGDRARNDGFDDQGRQFDAAGNLRDWWTKHSADEYDKRRKAVVEQYSEYEPLPGTHINGELTQGENIADIGGLKLAYAALQKALDKNPQARNQKIDGF